jgi:hypothetical protein
VLSRLFNLFYRWFALCAVFGYVIAFGVYQDYYTRTNAMSATRASWVGSTQLFFLLFMGLPAGKLLDSGYFRQTTAFGSLLFVFSFVASHCLHITNSQICPLLGFLCSLLPTRKIIIRSFYHRVSEWVSDLVLFMPLSLPFRHTIGAKIAHWQWAL